MNKSPVEKIMDCLFFAPFGIAAAIVETLPHASQKGKDKISSQIASARFVGSFVVNKTQDQIQRTLDQTIGQIMTFGGLGTRPTTDIEPFETNSDNSSEQLPVSRLRPNASESNELSIASYDNLSASQIVQRLGGLSVPELQAIRDYEVSHRNRRTILVRIEQLTSRASE